MIEKIKKMGNEAKETYALLDKDLTIVWMNKALQDKGFSSELYGKPYHIFSGKNELDVHCSTVIAAREKKITQRHEKGGDGKHYYVASVPILHNNETSHVLEIGREKKQMESMAEQLEDLKQAADHTNASVFIVDSNRRIVHVNEAYLGLHRCSEEDVLGNIPSVFHRKSEGIHSPFWRTMKKGQTWQQSGPGQRKDGSKFRGELKITPIKDSIGKTSYYVGMEYALE